MCPRSASCACAAAGFRRQGLERRYAIPPGHTQLVVASWHEDQTQGYVTADVAVQQGSIKRQLLQATATATAVSNAYSAAAECSAAADQATSVATSSASASSGGGTQATLSTLCDTHVPLQSSWPTIDSLLGTVLSALPELSVLAYIYYQH